MEAKAIAKSVRISPIKARLVVDLVRGKKVNDAINILNNRDKKASLIVLKTLNSAVANAEDADLTHNIGMKIKT